MSQFENLILGNVLNKAGVEVNKENVTKLRTSSDFRTAYGELIQLNLILSDWVNSHISMDNIGQVYEIEKKKVDAKQEDVCRIARAFLGIE